MNKNKKYFPLRTWTLAALITFAGVGCQKAAEDSLKILPPETKEEAKPAPVVQAKVEFKAWKELIGNYRLTQFNGQSVTTHYTEIEQSLTSFYDRTEKKYLDSVIFPLYANVGTGSDLSYSFGPIDGKGTTTFIKGENANIYTYKFDGPVTLQGVDIEMHLDMNVIKEGTNLYVTYTLAVPGHITAITRNFTLQKN